MIQPTEMRTCATCRFFDGADLRTYRMGTCTHKEARDNEYERIKWTGSLCWRYEAKRGYLK